MSAAHLVSCRQSTSGLVSASQSSRRGSLALTELTFQVAKRIVESRIRWERLSGGEPADTRVEVDARQFLLGDLAVRAPQRQGNQTGINRVKPGEVPQDLV